MPISIFCGLVGSAFQALRQKAFTGSPVGRIISKALSIPALGRVALRLSIFVKRLSLRTGSWSQRAIEYPWVLTQIKSIKSGSLVLDVGCAESVLSHELISEGFKVVGLDVRNYPIKSRGMPFIKRSVIDTQLPSEAFDAAIMISTIEHVGLSTYGQSTRDSDGDVKAMSELYRILKPKGILIVTTPYVGGNSVRTTPSERNYDRRRLRKLVQDFRVLREEYFYPRRLSWVKTGREQIGQQDFREPGLVCLVLEK